MQECRIPEYTMERPLTSPGTTLGVVGGGQLGRMLAEAAAPIGVEVVVLDPTPDAPAAPVSRDQLVAEFDDEEAVLELAERSDFLTYEIELADPDLLELAEAETGTPVHPTPGTLRTIQDKLGQKRWLREIGVPVPEFRAVDDVADLRDALDELGTPAMLKAREGGYDGRGNLPVESSDDDELRRALSEIAGPAMVEAFVPFDRELSVVGIRGNDDVRTYPVTETIHREEILRESVTPIRASHRVARRAREVATDVLDNLDGRGTFAVELFQVGEDVLVNEIAPRPHNSGHWTIEGAVTSQFEGHVRAVTGRPLGVTELRGPAPAVSVNILGDVSEPTDARLTGVDEVLSTDAHLHWYGKREVRPLRKMGHLTLTRVQGDVEKMLAEARELRDGLTFDP